MVDSGRRGLCSLSRAGLSSTTTPPTPSSQDASSDVSRTKLGCITRSPPPTIHIDTDIDWVAASAALHRSLPLAVYSLRHVSRRFSSAAGDGGGYLHSGHFLRGCCLPTAGFPKLAWQLSRRK